MITRFFVLFVLLAGLSGFAPPGRARFCPPGVVGVSNPGSTVCAKDANGNVVSNPCAVADISGDFTLSGCTIPASGDLLVYNDACPEKGLTVQMGGNASRIGGSWLNVVCTACVAPPSNMVAWWPFDETTTFGTSAQDIVGGNNGIYQGNEGPEPLQGMFVKNSLCFNQGPPSNVGWVEVPNAPAINFGVCVPFTIDLWVKTKSTAVEVILDKRTQDILGNIKGYHLFIFHGLFGFQYATDRFGFRNYVSPGPAINDGKWHLVAVTVGPCSNPVVTLYVDNKAPAKFLAQLDSIVNTANLQIGRRDPALGGDGYFVGCMDELEFYNRDLSQFEIVGQLFHVMQFGKCKPR
jgi:hypothetical protein